MNIAIIGTAGRGPDGALLTRESFDQMLSCVRNIILKHIDGENPSWSAISGGAAWADHIAVRCFVLGYVQKLYLELPCKLDDMGRFVDTGERDFRKNPGGTSNYYHRKFQDKTGIDSFGDLKQVMENPSCFITTGGGFFDRNTSIADKANHCIALTFGKCAELKDGGTADTMRKFLKKGVGQSFHVDLNDLKVYSPAIVK